MSDPMEENNSPYEGGEPEEEKTEEGDKKEEKLRGTNRFLSGMIVGTLVAFALFMLILFVPRITLRRSGSGNAGAKVLTNSATRSKLTEVRQIIEDYYLYDVDADMLEDYLFLGAAAGLDDPYAAYYTKEELSATMDSVRGEYYGIGATIGVDPEAGDFFVESVYEDSPASDGGLLPEDQVLALNGESVEDLTLTDLVSLIKEQETFTMTIYRPDEEEEKELTLTCADVTPKVVSYEMMKDGIAYLKLDEFTESAVDQFKDAVEDLNGQGMRAIVIDLRDNPGGLFSSVCDILDEILPGGLIVYTEDKNGSREEFEASEDVSLNCPLAVLVNENSASGAEIMAGAIQDYALGPVIGTQTYGKGVVQKTYSLSDGSALKLTVETYYTPNGQEIDGNGIMPDIVVEEEDDKDAPLDRALEELGG